MTLGELIAQVFEWLRGLWPFQIVADWEQGVRLRNGNATTLLTSANGLFGTGLHVCWPIIGEILVDETNIEVIETDLQTLTTRDGEVVTFSLAAKYRVRNLKSLYEKIHDADDTISEEIRSAAGAAVSGILFEKMSDRFGGEVLEQAKKQMHGWGLDLLSVSLVNLSKAPVIRIMGIEAS